MYTLSTQRFSQRRSSRPYSSKCIAVRKVATPLRELTCHIVLPLHSVTCHPAEVTFPLLLQPKLVLDLATPEGCKTELTACVCVGEGSGAKYVNFYTQQCLFQASLGGGFLPVPPKNLQFPLPKPASKVCTLHRYSAVAMDYKYVTETFV